MWRVTVRRGPKVERMRRASHAEALDALEQHIRALAPDARRDAIDLRVRRFEPADIVVARAELRGPQRLRPDVHAGLDLRGDGSIVAWTGGVRRSAVEPRDGETPYDALRRAVGHNTSVAP
jgi:hypothetical protein